MIYIFVNRAGIPVSLNASSELQARDALQRVAPDDWTCLGCKPEKPVGLETKGKRYYLQKSKPTRRNRERRNIHKVKTADNG